MKKQIIILFFLVLCQPFNIFSQEQNKNWIALDYEGADKIFINSADIKRQGDDIYIWVKADHSIPLVIESVKEEIHSTKTYYLINKKIMKYSILEIVYFDAEGNVLENFSYKRSDDIEKVKYNYPVFKGSDLSAVLYKCNEMAEKKEK